MKIAWACLCFTLLMSRIAGVLLHKSGRQEPSLSLLRGSDSVSSASDSLTDAIAAIEAGPTTTTGLPVSHAPMSLDLKNGKWPSRDSFDEVFKTVVSGGVASPCDAPLMGRSRISPYGFGAHMNQFANEVALAMYSGKSISLCAPPSVRDQWSVYFEDPGFGRCSSCDYGSGARDYPEMHYDLSTGDDQSQVSDIKHYIYSKLFSLKVDSSSVVSTALTSLGLDGPYVGVHVRRGDKTQEVELVPIEKYAAVVQEMSEKAGTKTVFLASDDGSVHAQLQQQLGSSYKVIEQARLPAEDYALRGDASRQMPPPFGEEDAEKSVLVDVAALVRSTAFIGTASSNIDKLVYFQRDPSALSQSLDEGGNGGFIALSR